MCGLEEELQQDSVAVASKEVKSTSQPPSMASGVLHAVLLRLFPGIFAVQISRLFSSSLQHDEKTLHQSAMLGKMCNSKHFQIPHHM